ncbi:hypothetical protein [Pseudomonas petrae]|uniref:DUF3077 domain-containing protein n=1 Tax=Pseudomonas petrae TaxID=2912190 RepID=A0ABS9IDV8_9PSED|nr:hypothetical protein [Pseudomonas petrae]MCF7537567.1 hypothetical protein [Pseudomonas petrae]MCF7545627.1 hypothetical protein [Pseudomonas petrae]
MLHPKSNTETQKAQDPVTDVMPFRAIDSDGGRIFQVASGICVIDALEDSSCLLSEILLFIRDYSNQDSGLKISAVHVIEDILINAKAIVDASTSGLMASQRSAPQNLEMPNRGARGAA